ncbi:cupin [Streptomyces sp. LP05-1]|uniref:Cupin n=1 Tax=Streptomyces pyxinae TaxID=2970734 RepID=A0ABT2CEN8_9ACTN|nr:cupin [Streptomyces sp. LP05-1]MCS0635877.1 cupin [Streptomyces sp. LP05-1]
MSDSCDLHAIAGEHLAAARDSEHGRSALLVLRQRPLRQTVIALTAGTSLDEHTTPPAASLQVLRGTVRVTTRSGDTELTTAALHLLPPERHGVTAVTDAAILLTAVND